MKPAPFEYAAVASVDDALRLLADDDEAVVLAGGQSLVPLLNFRLARPSVVVDLNPVVSLTGTDVGGDMLRIGALTRVAALERLPVVRERWPLLAQAARHVAHPAIRNRATVGGSVAHADPRAELPAALVALDARIECNSLSGSRTLSASEFFTGAMSTALGRGELVVAIEVPAMAAGARTAFAEHARTHGDFALAGAAVVVVPGGGSAANVSGGASAAIVLVGAGPVPVRATAASDALADGACADEVAELAASAAAPAAAAGVSAHRRALLAAVVRRALAEAGA